MSKLFRIAFFGLTMMASASLVSADEKTMLTIGSKAPSLDIEHWMSDGEGKFKHINDFEPGKVYVVEFWATWCGPCIASMPHISKLQDDYAKRGVTVISVSDEDVDTVKEFLEKETDEEEKTYGELTKNYCLTTDPDKSVHEAYMEAANQNGIPTAFIVGKKGLVEWIGHPMSMDEVLEKVVSDKWDRDSFAEEFKEIQELQQIQSSIVRLLRKGDVDGAIEKLDEVLATVKSKGAKEQLKGMRTQLLMQTGDSRAIEPFKEMVAINQDNPEVLNQLAWFVVQIREREEEKKIDKGLIAVAIEAAEMAIKADSDNGAYFDTLAHLQYMNGDLDKAIETQTKAVEKADDQFKDDIQSFLDELKEEKEKGGKDKEESDKKDKDK
jgi:thiol-disulfide isomerase/thioredoxin